MDETITPAIRAAARRLRLERERGVPGSEQQLAAWLEADARHPRAFAQIDAMWDELGLIGRTQTGRSRRLRRAPLHMRRSTHVAIGALAMAALAGVLVLGLPAWTGRAGLVTSAQAATYATRVGEIRKVDVVDGVQLVLDTGTVVRFSGGAGPRAELVRGRARFLLGRDTGGLVVVVPGGEIRADAATFDVSLVSGRPRVSTLRGDVHWRSAAQVASPATPTHRQPSPDRVLPAGRTGELDSPAGPDLLAPGQTQWVDGMLGFYGEDLGAAITLINRYNRLQISTRDLDASRLRVTGAFAARKPRAFAQAIAATFGLAVEVHGGDAIVLAAKAKPAN